MTKRQAIAEFRDMYKPSVPKNDRSALNEAWNNYTDMLCKTHMINLKQYDTWTNPF